MLVNGIYSRVIVLKSGIFGVANIKDAKTGVNSAIINEYHWSSTSLHLTAGTEILMISADLRKNAILDWLYPGDTSETLAKINSGGAKNTGTWVLKI